MTGTLGRRIPQNIIDNCEDGVFGIWCEAGARAMNPLLRAGITTDSQLASMSLADMAKACGSQKLAGKVMMALLDADWVLGTHGDDDTFDGADIHRAIKMLEFMGFKIKPPSWWSDTQKAPPLPTAEK